MTDTMIATINTASLRTNFTKLMIRGKFSVISLQDAVTAAENLLENNNVSQAARMLHKSLKMYEQLHGAKHEVPYCLIQLLYEYFNFFLNKMNSHALEMLGKGQINIAFQILFKCEEIYKRTTYKFDTSLAILTLNHLACCYKQIGQPKISRRILDDATQLLFKKNIITFRSITYLNKCAVLSIMQMHDKALENARIAADYFEKEILNMDVSEDVLESEFKAEFVEKVRMLTICYFNLSVEAEIVKDQQLCLQGIKQALRLYYFFLEDDPKMLSLYRK